MLCKDCNYFFDDDIQIPFCTLAKLPITFYEERMKLNNVPSFCPLRNKRS